MYCGKCGKNLGDDIKYCPNCGTKRFEPKIKTTEHKETNHYETSKQSEPIYQEPYSYPNEEIAQEPLK